jgi:hypothetical protein
MLEKYKNIQLPAFVSFPEAPTVYFIKDNGTNFYVEGIPSQEFNLVSEVEEYILKTLEGEVSFNSAELSRGEPQISGDQAVEGFIFEKATNRMIVSYTSQDTINSLKADYYDFLELDREYSENPEDWAIAYNWVASHPAFYHRNSSNATFWDFCNGWDSKWEAVYKLEEGGNLILIEHGPFIGTDRVQSTHDPRLDSSGENFEEAYIKFAKLVSKHYDILGEDRKLAKEDAPELF